MTVVNDLVERGEHCTYIKEFDNSLSRNEEQI
jgi:hypothetical protein